MGFDHFIENHCHMDDAGNDVGMNVEIMEDTTEASISALSHSFVTLEKAGKRYSSGSYREQNSMNCEETTNIEIYENGTWSPTVQKNISSYDELSEYPELYLLEDDKLVKPGDKFESLEVFVQYLNENAKRWNYYYSCSDSHKPNTEYESYTYNCVYLRNKEKYKKKGLRKRINNMKTNCPCQIKLRRLPNETELTVVEVCNYHDHELSAEQFSKLQHGRRLPPYVKEEVLDLLALQVNKRKIKDYVEMETGFRMGHPFFYALEKNMKKSGNVKREITEKRLQLLNEKLAAVDEMYGYNDAEHSEQNGQYAEESDSSHRSKLRKNATNKRRLKVSQASKQLKTADEVSSTTFTDKVNIEPNSEVTCSETLQSVKNLQELVKCEIQKNPWVSDQYLPVLPNRIALVENFPETHSETQEEQENETEEYIEYYNPDENTQESTKTVLCERNGFMVAPEVSIQNDTENMTYETVVMDENEIINNATHHYVINDNAIVHDEIANNDAQENNVVHLELQSNQDMSEVQYITEDNEHLVDFINQTNEEIAGHDVGVQTNSNKDTGQTLLPVFDVYMKDGNVMGFVVNNDAINGLKDGVDEGIQTSEDIIYSDIQEIENEDSEIIEASNDQNKSTYTKHEYVHRYNIEQYMTQSHFPRYVEILAKETQMDVLNMFTNVYNEKAMFKLTTTQKGNEGNTRIRYITHNGKIKKRKVDDARREKFGRNLQSIFILKEKMRMLKKKNEELIKKNEYLQEVALKLVNLG